jgi:hypothetical protein
MELYKILQIFITYKVVAFTGFSIMFYFKSKKGRKTLCFVEGGGKQESSPVFRRRWTEPIRETY